MDTHGWTQAMRLGCRQLWRDLRAGELRLLMLSVALAVAALTAVGFLADRMQTGLWRDARQLLGGDAVVVSDRPTPEAAQQEAVRRGLVTNTNVGFPTMARVPQADGASRLVALKAVAPGYPLRGALELRRDADAAQDSIPPRGQVWVDQALLDALDLAPGQTLALGERVLRISAVIEREPDRGAGFMNFAPRVMMNIADLASTALVQPASRVTWRMAVAGPEGVAQAYAAWARTQAEDGQWRGVQVESLESGRPEMRQTLDRASQFLNLVALLAALLCAVALALPQHPQQRAGVELPLGKA
ncbi:MAG: ABC transporter permease, partial [Limnohabitans sp.]